MEYEFEEGIEVTINRINQLNVCPLLVSFYGLPNSGKSRAIYEIKEYFKKQGLNVGYFGGSPSINIFERINEYNQLIDLLLFHCAWGIQKFPNGEFIFEDDPNVLAKNILGRELNLNIGIYNPKLNSKPEGDFDYIICNPNSKNKIF